VGSWWRPSSCDDPLTRHQHRRIGFLAADGRPPSNRPSGGRPFAGRVVAPTPVHVMIDFKKYGGTKRVVDVTDPLKLFGSLDVKTTHTTLRPSQIEALQALAARRADRDIVLKMNTGAGKTTVSLLYLRSHAAEKKRPVVYLCPTTQLVGQVLDEADRLGIPAVDYPGGEPHPETKGMSGDAVIVCTYDKLFNARTTFDRTDVRLSPCAIVLDDAHAGVERVRDAFTIRIEGGRLDGKLPGLLGPSMKAYKPGVWSEIERGDSNVADEVPYWIWRSLIDQIRAVLVEEADGELKFVWSHLREQLEWCRCVISGAAVEIVPDIVPVERVRAYNDAPHRLFTSATLADDSILVRELGCAAEAALSPVRPASDQGVGERMVISPSLIDKSLDRKWVMRFCENLSKRVSVVVLASSKKAANEWAAMGATVVTGDDVDDAVKDLRSGKIRFVAFANRYDGVDLPDDSCRVLVLDGMPYGESVTSRYDSEIPGRPGAAHNRLVHRVEQGMGRAVRSHADFSVVILAGPELAHFVSRVEVLDLFNPSTRAQMTFVHELSDIAGQEKPDDPAGAASDLVWSCLNRSESWKDIYDERVRGAATFSVSPSPEAVALAKAERAAARHALRRDAGGAADEIEKAVSAHARGEQQKGWFLQIAARYRFAVDQGQALQVQAAANHKNDRMFPPPSGTVVRPDRADREDAPVLILRWYGGFRNVNGALARLQEIAPRLSYNAPADTVEQALMDLATLFGAEGSRPEKIYRRGPDDVWLWSDLSAVVEVKNEAENERLPKKDSGQLHDSLKWFSENHPTRTPTPLMVARATEAEDDAHFPDGTRVLTPEGIGRLLRAIETFLADLVKKPAAQWTPNEVGQLLARHKLSARQFMATYTVALR
jgi:hypothetical protein